MTSSDKNIPSVVCVIGLGEVGTALAGQFLLNSNLTTRLASRPSQASKAAAAALGADLYADIASAVRDADVVLICATAKALRQICDDMAGHLKPGSIVADLTASTPEQVRAAADQVVAVPVRFVDVAIMGAISIGHAKTPMVCAGPHADELAHMVNGLGLNFRAMADSDIGDASRLKLARSVFAKGMEALLLETALAAETLGFWDELELQLDNFDQTPMREHLDMYLRTHLRHAERRHTEMEAAEEQLKGSGLPSLTTKAAVNRYRRTTLLLEQFGAPPDEIRDSGRRALRWLLEKETKTDGGTAWGDLDEDV